MAVLAMDCEPGPCEDWATPGDLHSIDVEDWVDLRECCILASRVLWQLSGARFCQQQVTVRPEAVNPDCSCFTQSRGLGLSQAFYYDPTRPPVWWNCHCGGGREIRLDGVVNSVTSVTIGGVVLDPSAYAFYNESLLVRLDGSLWPCCQELWRPLSFATSWQVVYTKGRAIPHAGHVAAKELARQIALGVAGSSKCQLPPRVTNVVRRGSTFAMIDSQDFLDHGRTGLYLCDAFLKAVNPAGLIAAPEFSSPDIRTSAYQ